MSAAMSNSLERIRLVFDMERADNPRLFDDLIRFKKGSKRVNRLRTLAQEGLLAQHWALMSGGPPIDVRSEAIPVEGRAASITNQVFDEPLME